MKPTLKIFMIKVKSSINQDQDKADGPRRAIKNFL
jgi:hypothetical protein